MRYPTTIFFILVWCGFSMAQSAGNSAAKAESSEELENKIKGNWSDTIEFITNCCKLSALYNKKSQYVFAERQLDKALHVCVSPKHNILKGKIYIHYGNTYKIARNQDLALRYFLKATDIFESLNDYDGQVELYTNMAEHYRSASDFVRGRFYIKKALTIYNEHKVNSIPRLINIYNRLAAIDNESNATDSSEYYSLMAIKLARQIGDKRAEAVSFNEIGYMLFNRVHFDPNDDYRRSVIKWNESGTGPSELGKKYLASFKLYDSSMKCFNRSIKLWTETGTDDIDAVHAKWNVIQLMSRKGVPKKKIIPYYEEIIKIVTEKKLDYPLDVVYGGFEECYFYLGDSLTRYKMLYKHMLAAYKKFDERNAIELAQVRDKYENDKIKKEYSQVSSELSASQALLDQKKRESTIVYSFLAIVLMMMLVVVYLLVRLNRSNKSLQQKNSEKDILIQEIHHRVKNNLQFVSSLINMQINSSENSEESYSLNDASRRIKAMALVHEMLYNQNEMKGINIKQYLLELVDSMNELVNSSRIPIQFTVNADPVILDTQRAIAIGMITSELVSNSLKYAFQNHPAPTIIISLKQESGSISYSVQDNGIGFVETNDQRKKLGMRLINIFSRQLKGEFAFESAAGFKYIIHFKY